MSVFEKIRMRLKIKSPVHIGSVEQKVTPFEYIQYKGYVYQISEEKFAEFLFNTKLLNLYLSHVQTEGYRFRIYDFLKENNISLSEEKLIKLSGGRRAKLVDSSSILTEYRPFIKDGFNEIYIPGTSIKGVIRTAILYNVLKEFKINKPDKFRKQIEELILKDIKDRKNKKYFFKWGNERWLEGFVLGDKKKSPHTDWLRMLHVSDAYPVKPVQTEIIPVNILKKEPSWTYKKESSGNPTTIWVETIPEGAEFEFDLSWDRRLFEEFKRANNYVLLPETLGEIFEVINLWAKDIFEFEKAFLKGSGLERWYDKENSNFRIGFGSGMISTTIAMLLEPETRKKIRNYAGLNRGNDEAPKSRRVWKNSNSLIPLGWVVLEVV